MGTIEKIKLIEEQAERRLPVELDGIEFILRIPTVEEMAVAGVDPITGTMGPEGQEAPDNPVENMKRFYPMAKKVVALCLEDPKVFVPPEDTEDAPCPEDQIHIDKLQRYVMPLATAVFSVINSHVEDVGQAVARFRLDTNGSYGGGDGDDVRGTTE